MGRKTRDYEDEISKLQDMVEVRDFELLVACEEAEEIDEILERQDEMLIAASDLLWAINYDPLAEIRALVNSAAENSTVVSKAKLQDAVDRFSLLRG